MYIVYNIFFLIELYVPYLIILYTLPSFERVRKDYYV